MNKDILICGVGGQGTVLASKLIASAAVSCGETVHTAETIGMAQRGGSVTSHVRIGEEAFSPLIPSGGADLILAFEPAEAVRNLRYLKADGTVLVSSIPVKPITESLNDTGYDGRGMLAYLQRKCRCLVIDAQTLCAPFHSTRYFNVAILGASVGAGVLGMDAAIMQQEIKRKVPEKFIADNIAAFRAGLEMGERFSQNGGKSTCGGD